MITYIYILIFLFGGAIGSFINVIADRLYIKSFLGGRSHCDSCNKTLKPKEMVPIFSYLFLRGRCSKCKTKLSARHFWVELILGVLFILTFKLFLANYFFGNNVNILSGIIFSIYFILIYIVFFVILLYDMKHKIVPTGFSLFLIVLGIASLIYKLLFFSKFFPNGFNTLFFLEIFSGFLIAIPFLLIYLFSRGRGCGFGDVVIFFGIGYLLGFVFGLSTLFLSIWIGAIFSVILLFIFPKKYNKKISYTVCSVYYSIRYNRTLITSGYFRY